MNPERERLLDIDYVLSKYQQGYWSATTTLAAIIRIQSGVLDFKEDR